MKIILNARKILVIMTYITFSNTTVNAGEAPKVLSAYLEQDKPARAEVVRLDVPAEFREFELILLKAKEKNPKWYKEQVEKSGSPSTIPPYHEKLGIKKEEYDKYLKIWDKRKYVKVEDGDVQLMLTENPDKTWVINATGKAKPISAIKYIPEKDIFKSGLGILERIEDIDSPADSIYRAWKGHEWRFYKKDPLITVKENIAIGRTSDKRYGILIHSLQEMTAEGTPLADRLMIIRFVPKKVK